MTADVMTGLGSFRREAPLESLLRSAAAGPVELGSLTVDEEILLGEGRWQCSDLRRWEEWVTRPPAEQVDRLRSAADSLSERGSLVWARVDDAEVAYERSPEMHLLHLARLQPSFIGRLVTDPAGPAVRLFGMVDELGIRGVVEQTLFVGRSRYRLFDASALADHLADVLWAAPHERARPGAPAQEAEAAFVVVRPTSVACDGTTRPPEERGVLLSRAQGGVRVAYRDFLDGGQVLGDCSREQLRDAVRRLLTTVPVR